MRQALAALDVLRSKYRIERMIGRGGMGTVHLATHLAIGQRVAIKVVRPSAEEHAVENEYVVARFLREARAAALLQSEHVVRILDVDAAEDGSPFMVMEYLEGQDLGAILKQRGRFAVGDAVLHVLEACEALAEAHARGIVHRDLKPSNLFLANLPRGPAIKLLDFGISKIAAGAEDLALTDTRAVIGSPLFMSPEQLLSSRDVDSRTDVWSMGVTLYQLVSGEIPFEASSASGLGAQIAARDPRPLSHALPGASPELEAVVMRCLRRDPAERHPDIRSLARAIAAAVPSREAEAAVAAVERAHERGSRDRASLPAPGAQVDPPPMIEASGERWTQSRAGAVEEPVRETMSRASAPVSAPPPAPAPPPAAPEPPRAEPRRRWPLLLLAIPLVAALAFGVHRATRRAAPIIVPSASASVAAPDATPIASPAVAASTSASPSTSTSTSTSASASVKGGRRAAPPKHAPKSGKDPSELELK